MFIKSIVILGALCILSATMGAPQSNQMAGNFAGQAATNGQIGKPQVHVNGMGAGNNGRNWGANANVGVGMKAWESQNGKHSVGVGANYGQSFGRFQGQSWKSRPDIGVGAGYSFKFGGGGRRG